MYGVRHKAWQWQGQGQSKKQRKGQRGGEAERMDGRAEYLLADALRKYSSVVLYSTHGTDRE